MPRRADGGRRALWGLVPLLLLCSGVAGAHHLVPRHELRCDATFPCPPELQRRVDFWAMVFREWHTGQLVFHNTKHPERVYKVVDTGASCRRRNEPREVRRERQSIRSQLLKVAGKLERGERQFTASERHLLGLFPGKKAAEVRAAADNIRCQQGNRDRFAKALHRAGAYHDMIAKALREAGLPADIVYLPFVESAYNPDAYSRVGAAGLWQIMPRTARTLGLEVSATLDERMDPEAATRAAMRYFTRSTAVMTEAARAADPKVRAGELNPFVITSYNYGIAGMKRAIKQVGPDYIRVLETYRSRAFRTAVRNFYASFLAARHVAQNAPRYFGEVRRAPPLRYDTVVLKRPTSVQRIEEVFGVGTDELKTLNRAWTRYVWNGWRFVPEGYPLRLPPRTGGRVAQAARLESLPLEEEDWAGKTYHVRKGDTACGIAAAFRVRCRDLIDANALGRGALIRVGQKLVIPTRAGAAGSVRVAGAARDAGGATRYRVRAGDTACGIAKDFGVACARLIRANRLDKGALIRVGQSLTIPGTAPAVAARERPATHRVRRGDTACAIATRYGVDCRQLIAANELGSGALIRVGQVLTIPSAQPEQPARAVKAALRAPAADAAAVAVAAAPRAAAALAAGDSAAAVLDAEVDYGVRIRGDGAARVYTIRAAPDETFGHYADWLGLDGTHAIRSLNGIRAGATLRVGQRIRLPIRRAQTAERFQQKRTDYHRVLIEEFKEHYRIVGVETYRVKPGDSLWAIASDLELPLWVVDRFNPGALQTPPGVGDPLRVPVVRGRKAD